MSEEALPTPMTEARVLAVTLLALSVLALVVRLYAAKVVGFGDSEALYASYALFPSGAYVDHPGLIGVIARVIGGGSAPLPERAHWLTSIAATAAPWAVVLAARMLGAVPARALLAGIVTLAAPEVAIGLFGMTPDLPLFFAWTLALGCFGRALTKKPGGLDAAALFVGAGVLLGIGCASKVSGLTLVLACVVTLSCSQGRQHGRTLWPWVGLALTAIIFSPVLAHEAQTGWPMLQHRLVDTQHDAGVSLRNLFGVAFGQAAYVSPLLAVSGVAYAVSLHRARRNEAVTALLASAVFVPVLVLGGLCVWSRVAEPHWLAPAWLALPLYVARTSSGGPPSSGVRGASFGRAAVVSGLALSAIVYAWVLVPALVGMVPQAAYDPRLDIANELYGWPEVTARVGRIVDETRTAFDDRGDVVVVGPVWMVSAQLRAALRMGTLVGCLGPDDADFRQWAPRSTWAREDTVIFVHDNRAPQDSAALFPDRTRTATETLTITRGGHVARVFTIETLSLRATADALQPSEAAGAIGARPASRMRAMSSASSGFGVVRSLSP